jgi:putative peptidoglycan lipid II flippase
LFMPDDVWQTLNLMSTNAHNRLIVKSVGVIMVGVLASRFLGFLREWTVAHLIGSNALTDTYYAAFSLPDILNYLVAGAAIEVIFVPVFWMYLADDKKEEAWRVFSTIMTFVGLLLCVLIGFGEIFAAQIVRRVVAPGFNPADQARVVFLTRLMLPAQLFLCLGMVLNAVQYTRSHFAMPVLGVIVANLGVVLGGWFLSSRIGIAGFAVGLLAGNFCGFFLLQVIAVMRLGGRFRPNLHFGHPGFRLFLKLAFPIMLALSVIVTDDWLLRWFGSFLAPASISWLTYSKTLMRAPLMIVGHAIGVASFPLLTELYAQGQMGELNRTLNHAIRGLLLFLVPVSAFAIALSDPIIYLVFSHTRMSSADLHSTASALVFFSIGMFAWGLQNLISRGFYAMRDMITPAVVGTTFTFLNIPLYWYLAHRWEFRGLAIASSWSVIAYTIVIFILLVRKTGNPAAWELARFLGRVVLACIPCAVCSYYLAHWLEARFVWQTTLGSLEVLLLVTPVGLALAVLSGRLLRIKEVEFYFSKVLALLGTAPITVSN